ncbi:hypothetical protein BFW38_17395 [Terasakiispira papahanaumokuakeensis]|uniref:Methyltransferase n=1 Tax=Terasakiispira papahanaumokuakeensis TaxID=197479 RepID=A0A1E2VDL4_9GAMM|nr:50S ribosomal protein L11 methyltransferase [Terasakiispira papahanaumokuakeensis]ODC05043.1 hypothetical protein BFW38_17395 [Terasakiispira papahanaumokuakeensis]
MPATPPINHSAHHAPERLVKRIDQLQIGAHLSPQTIDSLGCDLWLLDGPLDRPFSEEEMTRLADQCPMWSLVWPAGWALAHLFISRPEWVEGRNILDLGAGSAVVGIAALRAGARSVTACDTALDALEACRANAQLNQVNLQIIDDLEAALKDDIDLIVAADLLYTADNQPLLQQLPQLAPQVLLAESHSAGITAPDGYQMHTLKGRTWPDLDTIHAHVACYFYDSSQHNHNSIPM